MLLIRSVMVIHLIVVEIELESGLSEAASDFGSLDSFLSWTNNLHSKNVFDMNTGIA